MMLFLFITRHSRIHWFVAAFVKNALFVFLCFADESVSGCCRMFW